MSAAHAAVPAWVAPAPRLWLAVPLVEDEGRVACVGSAGRVPLGRVNADGRRFLRRLASEGVEDVPPDLSRCLRRLQRRGLLSCHVAGLATLAALPPRGPLLPAALVDRPYQLSRFVLTRRDAGGLVAESPAAGSRVVIHDVRVWQLLQRLAHPSRLAELTERSTLAPEEVGSLLQLLTLAGMVQDERPALRTWELADLVFHTRPREDLRSGAPVPGPAPIATIPLERPDRADPPFVQVVESRASQRSYGSPPITRKQLGEFLFRVSRTSTIDGLAGAEALTLHLAVDECLDLERGLYSYHPAAHALAARGPSNADFERLLVSARDATGLPGQTTQVLIVLGARFAAPLDYQRLLQQVGALFQTMYLSAAAMGLGPCALGGGDAELFARLLGTTLERETSVGEFLLGSQPCR